MCLSLLPLLLASAPAGAGAQESRRAPPAAGAGLTLAAFSARQGRRLLARDTDGDGKIAKAEFLAGGGRGGGGKRAGGDPARRFAAMDRNGDGAIDKGEMDGAAARRFARLDADRNGVLTAAERIARRRDAGGPDD